jgi:hypothetical protein
MAELTGRDLDGVLGGGQHDPGRLDKWLETEDSRSVGWTHEGETEAVGHQEGRRIVAIKRKKNSDLSDEDYAHMRKVVGYVHRHLAQAAGERQGHSALALLG